VSARGTRRRYKDMRIAQRIRPSSPAQTDSSAAAWQRALAVSVLVGLTVWVVIALYSLGPSVPIGFVPRSAEWLSPAIPALPPNPKWTVDVVTGTIVAHVVFTSLVSLFTWRLQAWQPGSVDGAAYLFTTTPPRFSPLFTLASGVALAAPYAERSIAFERHWQLPSEAACLLLLASLCVLAVGQWVRWLWSIGRLAVYSGTITWTDRVVRFALEDLLSSQRTVIALNQESAVCARLPGAPRNEEWEPPQRLAQDKGYREPAADIELGESVSNHATYAPSPFPNLGGDIRRWWRVIALILLWALASASVVTPSLAWAKLKYYSHGFGGWSVLLGLMLLGVARCPLRVGCRRWLAPTRHRSNRLAVEDPGCARRSS
jgi:hypothetical protein